MSESKDLQMGRTQGIAFFLAEYLRSSHGEPIVVMDLMNGAGLRLADFAAAKADGFDMRALRDAVVDAVGEVRMK